MWRLRFKTCGFSLIELMAVISILSLLVTLSISLINNLKIKAARVEATFYLKTISTYMHSFHAENGMFFSPYTGGPPDPSLASYGLGGLRWSYGPAEDSTEGVTADCDTSPFGQISHDCRNMRYHYTVLVHDPDKFTLQAIASEMNYSLGWQRRGKVPINASRCTKPAGWMTSYYADVLTIDHHGVLTVKEDAIEACN